MGRLHEIKFIFAFLIIVIVAVLLNLSAVSSARADAWGANMQAAIAKQTMERIQAEIHGAIMGALKQAAAETINDTVNALVYGSNARGGALYITNWEDYLVNEPQREVQLYMNDFFTLTTRGAASAVNYNANRAGTAATNYVAQQFDSFEQSIWGGPPVYDLDNYCNDPNQVFAQGNWRCFNASISNPMNNPFGRDLVWRSEAIAKTAEIERLRSTQALTYRGYLPQTINGEVITPGSLIADIQAQAQNIPNMILATAQNIPEVITAVVTRMITQTIRQGIGNAQRTIQKEVINPIANERRDIDQEVRESGPGSIFQPQY